MIPKELPLNNGVKIPLIGMGTFPLKGMELRKTLQLAFSLGYRLLDSAWLYKNETDIRQRIRENDINREFLFLTSKLHFNNLFLI